jgi:hypothetical protein
MKTKLLLLAVLVIFLISAIDLPPALPSSFYGKVEGFAGQAVNVYVGSKLVAHSTTFTYPGWGVVYSVDISMDGIKDGAIAVFKINGVLPGRAALRSGTIFRMDLKRKW